MAKSSTNLIKNNILTKPYLITVDELNSIGQNLNLVGYDNQLDLGSDDSNITLLYGNSSSPKLLNWVEPFEINGSMKTLFYTEVNSGFNVGDRVFIVNGTYDSNELIKKYKYTRGNDGYKVLYVDRCIVVLDINYTGLLPSDESTIEVDKYDEFIKVYYVKDEKDFLLVNRQITSGFTSSNPGENDLKFNKKQNNFIYVDREYVPTVGWGSCIASPTQSGFYNINNGSWEDVSSTFLSQNFTTLLSNDIDNNHKFIVINGTFNFNGKEYRENQVYEFNGNEWVITVKHENNNTPIITKSNFRDGYFNGKWNGGCYGSNVKRIKWHENDAIWNSGTLLNTQWKWGFLNSLYSQRESYIAEFDDNNKPYQRSTNPDNDGYGYNFVINSELENYVINNGNLSNSILGSSFSNNIVLDHVTGNINQNYIDTYFTQSLVKKSVFENCYIINSNIENSIVKDSRSLNSRFLNVKSINSHYNKSVFKNSNFISDNVIKILDVFKETIILDGRSFTYYKLYINKRSSEKFRFKDSFYIKGLKISESNKIIDFFDRKFKIGVWDDYVDEYLQSSNGFYKKPIESSAFISTPIDNKNWGSGRKDYSIDIFINDINTPDVENIDFSNAYILNSDFESGIFENSNWNSGYHINYNSDNNITLYENFINSDNTPIYDISIDNVDNNILNISVNTKTKFTETELDYFNVGDIMFLNSIEYDLRGSVLSVTVSESGSGYSASNVVINGTNGRRLEISYTCDVIGSVPTVSDIIPSNLGGGLIANKIYDCLNVATSSTGSGLSIQVYDSLGSSYSVITQGSGYMIDDEVFIIEADIISKYKIVNTTIGKILDVDVVVPGVGYNIGDELTVPGGTAKIIITDITGDSVRIPDTYKIVSGGNDILKLRSIDTVSISATHGLFITSDSMNRYNYLNKVKFYKSKIVSGIFRRAYFNNCLIRNNNYDVNDRDFFNINRIKELVITDTLFKGNKNILSDGLYYNSFFIKDKNTTNDTWQNGIAYNSVWNGLSFNNGLFKESTWRDGTFENGLFYSSRSFDNVFTNELPYVNNNRVSSYYISGFVNPLTSLYNNRYSWQNGNFKNGEFYKSDWEDGTFDNGKFYYSKFYNGSINGGIIGDRSISDTYVYRGLVTYTTVENAIFESNNNEVIEWRDGIFNNGIFSANNSTANWLNGIFNGGQFKENARWFDGTFNDGRFLSTYGYGSYIGNKDLIDSYSWVNGIFNGGEFGNGSTQSNSTWFNGEFNGGIFKGKEWHDGIFLYGEFIGSGDIAIGGMSSSNANSFTDTFFTESYYGLWRNGYFTDIKDKFIKKEQYTDIKRANSSAITKRSVIKNALWLNGTFSHPGGEINNSVWRDGIFENGTMIKSSFNPFVYLGNQDKSFNLSDTCLWKNGRLVDSEFYISRWKGGNFISGTGIGMIWENGISNYMNAYNIQWENGIWKNGNWNGSFFTIPEDGIITDEYTRNILLRGMSYSATSSCHIWNLFYQDDLSNINNNSSSDGSELTSIVVGSDLPPTAPTILNG